MSPLSGPKPGSPPVWLSLSAITAAAPVALPVTEARERGWPLSNTRRREVMTQLLPTRQGSKHDAGNRFLAQIHGSVPGSVDLAIHPDKGFPAGKFVGRRIQGLRQAAMQMPGDKKPPWRRDSSRRQRISRGSTHHMYVPNSRRRLAQEHPEGRWLFVTWHLRGSLPQALYPPPDKLSGGKESLCLDGSLPRHCPARTHVSAPGTCCPHRGYLKCHRHGRCRTTR